MSKKQKHITGVIKRAGFRLGYSVAGAVRSVLTGGARGQRRSDAAVRRMMIVNASRIRRGLSPTPTTLKGLIRRALGR